MILNSKKIGSAEIEKYAQMQGAQQKQIFDEKMGQEGVLGKIWGDKKGGTNPNPLDTVWRERLGDLQSILNGTRGHIQGCSTVRPEHAAGKP